MMKRTFAFLGLAALACVANAQVRQMGDSSRNASTQTATGPAAPAQAFQAAPSHAPNQPAVGVRQFNQPTATTGAVPVAAVDATPFPRLTVDDVMRARSPLTDAEILQLRERLDRQKRAIATAPGEPLTQTMRDFSVDLRPGAEPPRVRVATGQVTYLNFIDAAGNPWPLREDGVELPPVKCVEATAQAGDSSVGLSATTTYGSCSLGIRLEGLSTPLVIVTDAGQGTVDSRLDLRIPRRREGMPAFTRVDTIYDAALQQLLDIGTAPGAVVLKTSSAREVEAWLLDGKRLIVRTRPGVLVTGFRTQLPGADGSTLYELSPTPIVMVRAEGSGIMRPIEIVDLPAL